MKKIILPALISFCVYASGQTYNAGTVLSVYEDIPDTLIRYCCPITSMSYAFDLFDNPSDDIRIVAYRSFSSAGGYASIEINSLNPHVDIRFGRWDSVYEIGSQKWNVTKVARPLAAGELINPPSAIWDSTLYLTDHSGHQGGNKNVNDFIGGDKYLGFKYDIGSVVTYGWIRVECVSEDSCYVKDFSYNPVPLAVNEIGQNEIALYPNPGNSSFYLEQINADNISNTIDVSKLKLVNIYGRHVKFTCEVKANRIKINPDRNLPAGCYMLQYFSGDNMFSKKLIRSGY